MQQIVNESASGLTEMPPKADRSLVVILGRWINLDSKPTMNGVRSIRMYADLHLWQRDALGTHGVGRLPKGAHTEQPVTGPRVC